MKTRNAKNTFENMPVPQAVLRNVLPAMGGMLMVLIYNLADTFFIGQTHDAYQVAAVSLATPVFLIFMAVGTVFGVGGTSAISRAIGAGRKDYAKKLCSFCMWACVAVGIILTCAALLFMDSILTLIGASADTWEHARRYLLIVSCGGTFQLLSSCFSNILRAEGQAGRAMMGQALGNLLNIVFDPLLIFGLGWEISGAAAATVIGSGAAAAYYVLYFLRGKSSLSIGIADFTMKEGVCRGVLAIGVPAALAPVLMSVSQIIMNSMMAGYGDMAVAGIGVAMKVTMITGMLAMGIGQGIQPLLGYCVGARAWGRYQGIMKFSLCFALLLGAAMTGLCFLFVEQIVGVFLTDAEAFAYAAGFARILLSTSALFGVFYVLTNALQAMGAALPSLVINLSRQGLVYVPALLLLGAAMGADGLAWAQPAADILSTILAAVLYLAARKGTTRRQETEGRLHGNGESPLPQE